MHTASSSIDKSLPNTPPSLGTPSKTPVVQEKKEQRSSFSSSSNRLSMMPTTASKRLSGQPVPRPAPIPIPEPVLIPVNNQESSNEGPSSSESANSALASVSAELIQHITVANHSHSSSMSPSSPRETNNLLGDSTTRTPRSSSSPRIPTTYPGAQRPRSAVDTTSSSYGGGPAPPPNDPNNMSQFGVNRPHSSADAWAARPPSIHSNSGDQQQQHQPSSRSQSPSADSMLRPAGGSTVPRSRSSNFINTPSPLNPNALPLPRRPGSSSSRPASMVLYRLAGIGDDFNPQMSSLSPPVTTQSRRASRFSTMSSANSTYSVFSDSKYPMPAREDGSLTPPPSGAFLPYEYDPSWDQDAPDDAEDELHAPDPPGKKEPMGAFNIRGALNICVMVTILLGLITTFALYPVISHYALAGQTSFFSGSGQSDPANTGGSPNSTSTTRTRSDLIDPDTLDSVKTWAGLDGNTYKLVFSDEFNRDGRTFKKGDDPFWEAVDLHDNKNQDLQWYDSGHVTTKGGSLVISLEQKATGGYQYTSGMLQSWNNFCFTGGYVEVSVSLPGTNQNIGFSPQAYTMGNLARSGYGATEDGLVPYSYDLCDASVAGGDGTLSTLPAQRLSACTCTTEQSAGNHPGPTGTGGNLRGRGAPIVDILGYQNNQQTTAISQSFRVGPISTPRTGANGAAALGDAAQNPWTGTTNEEVLSGLVPVPAAGYVESGAQFTAFGYEHILNGGTANQGSLHWTKGTTETYRVPASAIRADDNAGVGQRLIPEEPMYIVLSLALSNLAAQVDTTALTFPAKFLVDYVRVYQIDGQDSKVSCDPTDYPTLDYITKHPLAYSNPNALTWASLYTAPTNSQTGTCA